MAEFASVSGYQNQTVILPENECQKHTENSKKKGKRSRNPDNWKKEKRKRAILSGQGYLNTNGEFVGPRSIGPDCNCKHRCFVNVSSEIRSTIFNGYYSLKSYDEQNAYLYGLIRRYDIQRKRKPNSERRTCSYKYYVRIKGREVQVCKKAFANIHGISDKKIRTLCIKHEQNILFPRDNRGRHNNRPKKVTPELVTLIKRHILKILSGADVSDFIKTDKNQGPDVNISKLHKSFLMEYQPEAVDKESDKVIKDVNTKVKSWLYFKVFHEEFNSMDFHTVKRKLSDLRKSLEVGGGLLNKKKSSSTTKQTNKRIKNILPEKDSKTSTQEHPYYHIAVNHCPTNPLAPTHIGYASNGQHQQHSTLPHNFQLNMLNIPSIYPHGGSQHLPQQPLNLQTGGSVITTNDPPHNPHHPPPPPQPFPLNFHSVTPSPMSSYYLCLGHVSNIIPIPVSSTSTTPPTSTHQPQNNHLYNNVNFSPLPNTQHHQLPSPPSLLQSHPTSLSITQPPPSSLLQSHPTSLSLTQPHMVPTHPQTNIAQGYTSQTGQMY